MLTTGLLYHARPRHLAKIMHFKSQLKFCLLEGSDHDFFIFIHFSIPCPTHSRGLGHCLA